MFGVNYRPIWIVKDLVEGTAEDQVEGAVEDLIEGGALRGEGTGSVFLDPVHLLSHPDVESL